MKQDGKERQADRARLDQQRQHQRINADQWRQRMVDAALIRTLRKLKDEDNFRDMEAALETAANEAG